MINKFNDYETTQAASANGESFPKLPAGGYEAKVLNVRVNKNQDGTDRLEIMVDITEGEFKNYFKNKYDNTTFENKKFGGVVRYSIPTDDGSDKDAYKKRFFKGMITSFEESNPGFKWNWDEQKLKGLKIGIYVRDKEYDFNGHHGFSPEVFAVGDINVIKRGEFETPKAKYLNGNAPSEPTQQPQQEFWDMSSDEYPF